MANAAIDGNYKSSLLGVSNADGTTPLPVYVDSATNRLLVNSTGGSSTAATSTIITAGTSSVNVYQVGGNTVSVNNGTADTGTQRVTLASDSTGQVALAAGSQTVGTVNISKLSNGSIGSVTVISVPSNMSVNIAQMNGVTTSMGNGSTDTGTQRVTLSNDSTGIVSLTTGSKTVGTVFIGNSIPAGSAIVGTVTVNSLPATPAGSNIIGTVTVNSLPALASGSNQIGTVTVNALPAGSNTVGTVTINGNVANDGVDTGNPVKVGGLAKTSNPTAVADGDRVNALYDKLGKQIAVGAVRDLKANQFTPIYNNTGTVVVVTAGGANVFCDIYGIIVTNLASSGNYVKFSDSANGTSKITIYVPANDTRGFMVGAGDATPQTTANNIWQAQCTTSGSVDVTVYYVKNL